MTTKAGELALEIVNSPHTLGISFGDGFRLKHAIQQAIEQYGRLVQEAAAKKAVDYTLAENGHSSRAVQANAAQMIALDIREMPLP